MRRLGEEAMQGAQQLELAGENLGGEKQGEGQEKAAAEKLG